MFASIGDSHETILKHIDSFRGRASNNVSIEQLPDLIIVNNSYYIWKAGLGVLDPSGKKVEYDIMILYSGYKEVGGMALLYLLPRIQKNYPDNESQSDMLKENDDSYERECDRQDYISGLRLLPMELLHEGVSDSSSSEILGIITLL